MTLKLKCISNVNLKNKPFFSKNFKKEKWLNALKLNSINNLSKDDDDLIIVCLQDLYGYRTGLIGYITTLLTSTINKYTPSTFLFSTIINFIINSELNCNDLDILAGIISILNRSIPFLNYGIWDYKEYFAKQINLFANDNSSINGMFNLNSIFLFKPFFDSGLCILSNKKCHESGFEKLSRSTNKYVNEGFLWSCFKKDKKNILILTLNISKNDDNIEDLKELFLFIDKLSLKFEKCPEIYISGDLKMNLDQCKHLFEDEFKILNNEETLYLLYKNNNPLKHPFCSKVKIDDDDNYIFNYNFTKKRHFSPLQRILNLKKIKYNQELKELKIDSFEENEKIKDDNKISLYKNFSVITENPIDDNHRIENYFKKTNSDNSISPIDDEWTKVDQII